MCVFLHLQMVWDQISILLEGPSHLPSSGDTAALELPTKDGSMRLRMPALASGGGNRSLKFSFKSPSCGSVALISGRSKKCHYGSSSFTFCLP